MCELLHGMCVLEDASLDVAAGILHRQLWETWVVSLYVLFQYREALSEPSRTRHLNEKFEPGSKHAPSPKKGARRLNYEQIAKEEGRTVDCRSW